MILIKGDTQPGQDLFLRGGIDHAFGNAHGRDCPTVDVPPFGDPKYHNCAVRIEHRNTINYGENHEPYAVTNRWQANDMYLEWYGREEFRPTSVEVRRSNDLGLAQGTPLDWTTNNPANASAVIRQGFGFLKENLDASLGDGYWMLDVDMDCETAVNIGGTFWFEVKSFITNLSNGWEPDVNQADRPSMSRNHFAKCWKINIFERGSSSVEYRDFDTVNQCSPFVMMVLDERGNRASEVPSPHRDCDRRRNRIKLTASSILKTPAWVRPSHSLSVRASDCHRLARSPVSGIGLAYLRWARPLSLTIQPPGSAGSAGSAGPSPITTA